MSIFSLITTVDEELWKSPTYKTFQLLRDLLTGGYYVPDINIAENPTKARLDKENEFLEAVMQSAIMDRAYEYLKKEGQIH